MGFQLSRLTIQRSPHHYQWVTQPKQLSGQCIDRVGLIDERCLSGDHEAMTKPKQSMLGRMLSYAQKLHLSWPQDAIGRSQPTHQ